MILEDRRAASTARLRRQAEADRLSAQIGCEVTPHPVTDVFEAREPVPGVWLMAGSAAEIRAEVRRFWMVEWLGFLGRLEGRLEVLSTHGDPT